MPSPTPPDDLHRALAADARALAAHQSEGERLRRRRYRHITQARDLGMTLAAIAELLGVDRQRVYQILRDGG